MGKCGNRCGNAATTTKATASEPKKTTKSSGSKTKAEPKKK